MFTFMGHMEFVRNPWFLYYSLGGGRVVWLCCKGILYEYREQLDMQTVDISFLILYGSYRNNKAMQLVIA